MKPKHDMVLFLVILALSIGGPIYNKEVQYQKKQAYLEQQRLERIQIMEKEKLEAEKARYTVEHDGNPKTSNIKVELDASESVDFDGDALSFSWQQTNGPKVELKGLNKEVTSFVAGPGEYSFMLTVVDKYNGSSTKVVTVVISPEPNENPEAVVSVNRILLD